MAIQDWFVMAWFFILAVETFAIWLEVRWDRKAARAREGHLAVLRAWVEAIPHPQPHQSMYVPLVAAPIDPRAVQDPRQRRVVSVTRDEPVRPEGPALPSYRAMPALGEDEDDTRVVIRDEPPTVRGRGRS